MAVRLHNGVSGREPSVTSDGKTVMHALQRFPILALCMIAITSSRADAQVCPIESPGNCQTGTSCSNYLSSDRLSGIRSADDFQPLGDTISRVCFSPCFRGFTGSIGYYCDGTAANRGTPPPDDFLMKIYEDDFDKPGLLLAGGPAGGLPLTIDAKAPVCSPGNCWNYTAAVNPPDGIGVVPGECYWLEITGLGEVQAQGTCRVGWQTAAPANRYAFNDYDNEYSYDNVELSDLSFCLDSGIAVATVPPGSLDGGCGTIPVSCCNWQAICTNDVPYANCANTPAHLLWRGIDCSDPIIASTCVVPPNDLCANAFEFPTCQNMQPDSDLGSCSVRDWLSPLPEVCRISAQDCLHPDAVCQPFAPARDVYSCDFPVNNYFALTDGPGGGGSCFGGGSNGAHSDVWHTYTAPCTGSLVLEGCPIDSGFDSIVHIYGDHTPTCRPCPITNNQFSLGCDDDGCNVAGGGSLQGASVTAGACYTIRVGGYSQLGHASAAHQGEGFFTIDVICNPPPSPSTPTVATTPHNVSKNRYISFKPMDGANTSAFRIDKTTSPVGSCWVGQPDAQDNARCQSSPLFRVWSEPVIHVGDCAIIPVATYEVRSTFDTLAFSSPLTVGTIALPSHNLKHWADLVGFNTGFSWSPPNQFTNVQDILAILSYITDAAVKPTFQQANLQAVSATDPCLNAFVNTADVLAAVKAVAGDPYPFTTNPLNCPACP